MSKNIFWLMFIVIFIVVINIDYQVEKLSIEVDELQKTIMELEK